MRRAKLEKKSVVERKMCGGSKRLRDLGCGLHLVVIGGMRTMNSLPNFGTG